MILKSCWTSRSVREAVGSSMTTALASPTRARAMATICWLAAESALTLVVTSSSTPSEPSRRSEEHTSELQSRQYLVCRLLLEKKKHMTHVHIHINPTLP